MDPRDEKWKKFVAPKDDSSQEASIVSVEVSPTKMGQLRAHYRYALLAKVLFRKIRIDHLYNHLIRVWSPMGTMKIQEHANDFFVIVFSDPMDYLKLVGSGPWMIAGHYITLQQFVFNFKPWEAPIGRARIWVRLPEYPVELYDEEVFQSIAKALGGYLVKIDTVTEKQVKVKFARLCIEVDLSRPLALCVEICGWLQKIEYEGLYVMCSLCRRVGHLMEECPFYSAQPELASQGSPKDGWWLQGVKSKEKQVQGSNDDSCGSSSDLINLVSTRYLQPDEGTSSFVMSDETPKAKEEYWHLEHAKLALKSLNKSDASKKPKTRHLPWKQTQMVQSCAGASSLAASTVPNTPQVKSLTKSLPTLNSEAEAEAEAEAASQSYTTEQVKNSTKHKEINAKSIHLFMLDEEPVILSTKPEVSSIQIGFSISPASSYKARIQVTPNEPGLNSHPHANTATVSPKKLLCCTCEGADDIQFAESINDLIKTHNPSVVFLSHISCSGSNTYRVINDSKFSDHHIIKPVDSFGGLLLLWRKEEVKVVIQPGNSIHINARVEFTEQDLV